MFTFETFAIEGPVLITPKRFKDGRGAFMEVYRRDTFNTLIGQDVDFVQDNQSYSSKKGTIRGLHAQTPPHDQGKLVRCIGGEILDVAVDIRRSSPTYGQYVSARLSAQNKSQLWVPPGFLHGFETLLAQSTVSYKQTNYYQPDAEIAVSWQDPALGIDWTVGIQEAIVSYKDSDAPMFADFETPFA